MPAIAEIIAIGTEITSGQKLDTNSQWLSIQLAELGIAVRYHSTVADDHRANIEVILSATQRADVVVITGGLGPTADDLTREVLAEVMGVDLELDAASLAAIEHLFSSRGREMPAQNRVQAMFPKGATPIPNKIGTAPGVWIELPRENRVQCRIAALPGVPSEMKQMFHNFVKGELPRDETVIRRRQLNAFGFGESQTEKLLGDLTARNRDPEIGITAHEATISLRIIAHANSEAEALIKLDTAEKQICEKLGDTIFGVDDEDLEQIVMQILHSQSLSVSICEAATAGDLISRLMRCDEADACCRGGLVGPQLNSRDAAFAVESSEEGRTIAAELAANCRGKFQSDFALAVTPWAEIVEGETSRSIAWVALASEETVVTAEARPTGNPAIFAARTSKVALDLLRRHLLGLPQLETV